MLYSKERNINRGSIFVTASGHPMDRSNIFREMKALSETACVDATKIFPHNLRHLFVCCYYEIEKDIDHLADLLGHSNINTTRIYLARSSEEQAQKLESLGLVI
ncbi:MAG: tyrosine-type recombinase/integrase [Fusicatenibacter sp.]